MADATTTVDWSDLPPELLQITASKLPGMADYIRFHAVCKAWRGAAPISPSHLPREFPWLMLPMSRSSDRRPFFKPLANNLQWLTLPEASHSRRGAGSSLGWLVLVDESPCIFLINPLTRDRITLPPLSSLPNVTNFDFYSIGREYTLLSPENELYFCSLREMRDSFIKKVILSHSPYNNPDFWAVAILNRHENLAYCKNGYESWRIIDEARWHSEDVIYFGGGFYAVDKFGSIAICEVNDRELGRVRLMNVEQEIDGDMKYLVDGGTGDLLLVARYLEFEIDIEHYMEVCRTVEFRVYRLDWDAQKWESMTSLGERVLFLGQNSSLAVVASGCAAGNRIYFTDDYSEGNYGGDDVGVYDLGDATIQPLPCCSHSHHMLIVMLLSLFKLDIQISSLYWTSFWWCWSHCSTPIPHFNPIPGFICK